jgi:hypothetical protein
MIVFERPCEKCGAPVRSDEEHHCAQKSKPSKKPTTSPVAKTEASSVSSPSSRRTVSPPEPVITPQPVITEPPVITPTTRFQKWHAKNRETHNARMRAYRAAQKAPE